MKSEQDQTLEQRLRAVRKDIKRQKEMNETTGRKTDRQWKFIDVLRNDQKKKQAKRDYLVSQGLDKDIRQHYENVLQRDEPINLLQSSPRLASSRKAAQRRNSDDYLMVSDLTAPVNAT